LTFEITGSGSLVSLDWDGLMKTINGRMYDTRFLNDLIKKHFGSIANETKSRLELIARRVAQYHNVLSTI